MKAANVFPPGLAQSLPSAGVFGITRLSRRKPIFSKGLGFLSAQGHAPDSARGRN